MQIDDQKVYTVSELNHLINDELSEAVVRVRGEITDFKRSQNGKFVYFDLKDAEARMSCFIMAFQLRQELENGMEAVVTGSPGLYVPYGKYTFRVRTVEPMGFGALKRAFELTRKKLESEGLFSEEYKKPIPRFPERIGLITSREAAAYSDFLRILDNRWGGIEVFFCNVPVQGEGASAKIAQALRTLNEYTPVPDVLVVTRGGGSLEDLQAFNDEQVCRAIFASKTPVVVGVGHERDLTLSDFVADARASTPSNAAELVVPSRKEVRFELDAFASAMEGAVKSLAGAKLGRIESLLLRIERTLTSRFEKGRVFAMRLEGAFAARTKHYRNELIRIHTLLQTLNPKGILKRGYSITQKDGRILKDVSRIHRGERVETILHKGKFASVVE